MPVDYLIGIDYSMSCPAISINATKNFCIKNCKFHYLTKTKKYVGIFCDGKVIGSPFKEYHSEEERFDNISEYVINIIDNLPDKKSCKVAIEGYSMGSKGLVFGIGENTGILKHKLFKNKYNFISVAPTSVKKLATTKGNSKKDVMYKHFLEETKLDLVKELSYDSKEIGSPVGDIVDSYFICKFLYHTNNILR
jgi:Holliday junction resolvasome RuvABC endonuclease subunit